MCHDIEAAVLATKFNRSYKVSIEVEVTRLCSCKDASVPKAGLSGGGSGIFEAVSESCSIFSSPGRSRQEGKYSDSIY